LIKKIAGNVGVRAVWGPSILGPCLGLGCCWNYTNELIVPNTGPCPFEIGFFVSNRTDINRFTITIFFADHVRTWGGGSDYFDWLIQGSSVQGRKCKTLNIVQDDAQAKVSASEKH